MSNCSTKHCPQCGKTKADKEFHKDKRSKSGLQSHCKECRSQFHHTHSSEIGERRAEYFEAHKDRKSIYDKAYHKANRTSRLEKMKAYRANNTNKVREGRKREYLAHKKAYIERARKRRAIEQGAGGSFSEEDVRIQGECQKWRCWWCGKLCKEKYHADHLIPLARGGHNAPSNIVVSCPKCNWSKHDKLPEEWAGRLF